MTYSFPTRRSSDLDADKRLNALEALWAGDMRSRDGYASRILTARAAARIEPDEDLVDQAGALVGSMLSAGLDRQAARWWPVLQGASESDAAEGWGLLSIGAPSALDRKSVV